MLGPVSVFQIDISGLLPAILTQSLSTSELMMRGLFYFWDFSNSSLSRSASASCFLDYARRNGTERDGITNLNFKVCGLLGSGFSTTSPYLVTDNILTNFSTSKGLKSKGWKFENAANSHEKPLSTNCHMVQIPEGALVYIQCSTPKCNNFMWSFSSSSNLWKVIPVVPSDSLLSLSITEVPSFVGHTVQFQNSRLYVIGGMMQIDSESRYPGRFTVATFDLNVDRSQAVASIFLYDDFSAVFDASSTSNGTHAFVFGGTIGWGRSEQVILVLSYALMLVSILNCAPVSAPAALFSAVMFVFFTAYNSLVA
jgi:hypothetical protein